MRLEDFAFDLRRSVAPDNHIAVNSGYTTVRPLPDVVAGVGEFFSPPFAFRGLAANVVLRADGHVVRDDANRGKGDCGLLFSGGVWHPHQIVRAGTYHHVVGGKLLSFAVRSTLTPLADAPGYVVRLDIRNRCGRRLELGLEVEIDPGAPGHTPLDGWNYNPGNPGAPAGALPATPEYAARWSNGDVCLALAQPASALALESGAEGTLWFAVLGGRGPAVKQPAGDSPAAWAERTRAAWEKRVAEAGARLPSFSSDVPGLRDYAMRGLVSGLICRWDHPDFAFRPYLATSGMDGGAICSYLWDVTGYAPLTIAQWLGAGAGQLARRLGDIGLDKYYAIAPGGAGVGCEYAYSVWSYMQLIRALALFEGPDQALFDHAKNLLLGSEAKAKLFGGLVDFGGQHNLLEMRGAGWEGVVASPNAERAVCHEFLADLADRLGESGGAAWRARAREIRDEIRRVLWNRETGWFDCIHPGGRRETVYSIQAFDAWRAGACDADMEKALLSHLRDGAFLSAYGASSVSAEDEVHYELNDPDWSGGGAYTGEGPLLALSLWEKGHSRRAWDVLSRLLWMGQLLPYYPQEHYCDRPASPAHKRANVIAGLAAWEACVFGLAGLVPGLDGSLTLAARDWLPGALKVENFNWRGRNVSVEYDPAGRRVARVDGAVVAEGGAGAAQCIIHNS